MFLKEFPFSIISRWCRLFRIEETRPTRIFGVEKYRASARATAKPTVCSAGGSMCSQWETAIIVRDSFSSCCWVWSNSSVFICTAWMQFDQPIVEMKFCGTVCRCCSQLQGDTIALVVEHYFVWALMLIVVKIRSAASLVGWMTDAGHQLSEAQRKKLCVHG